MRRRARSPISPGLPPHKVAAWGAHLLALDHRRLATAAARSCDKSDVTHHDDLAMHYEALESRLRFAVVKYMPRDAEHARCYRKAVETLKP